MRNEIHTAYGDPVVKTPFLDSLANMSLTFTSTACQYAYCAPSRNSFLVSGHGVRRMRSGCCLRRGSLRVGRPVRGVGDAELAVPPLGSFATKPRPPRSLVAGRTARGC